MNQTRLEPLQVRDAKKNVHRMVDECKHCFIIAVFDDGKCDGVGIFPPQDAPAMIGHMTIAIHGLIREVAK